MKKIFILTGEPSGDKLASKVIVNLKKLNSEISYLSVGGENLKSLGIKSIFDLKKITFLGFTSVIFNIFKIYNKINYTVKEIIKFNPDILFSVDSPDFTLRVAKKVKSINKKIKTIHYVAPQVWIWRENRVKKMKNFIDHILLLFDFEKKYFEKEKISCEFVGHPLLENNEKSKIDISQIIDKNKNIISIFPGSRTSEINILMPILISFVNLMKAKRNNLMYVFHSTNDHRELINSYIDQFQLKDCGVISDNKIKNHILQNSIFAVAKSGTISLEICNSGIPSIIIYKMNLLNYLIVKSLVNTKYANIINIAAKEEIIPELIQSNCNPSNIFKHVNDLLNNPQKLENQVSKIQAILNKFKTTEPSSNLAALSLKKFL